jgi:hypothetical protein
MITCARDKGSRPIDICQKGMEGNRPVGKKEEEASSASTAPIHGPTFLGLSIIIFVTCNLIPVSSDTVRS